MNRLQRRFAAIAFFGSVVLAAGQVPLGERDLALRLKDRLGEAQALFDDPGRQSQSIEFLTQILRAVEDEERARGGVSEDVKAIAVRARELRAIAYFNAGETRIAADDFRELIFADARYSLEGDLLSPKIVDFFEDQKKRLVGFITVNTEPPGARVTVDGVFYGLSNLFPQEIHVGEHRVEVSLEGYDTVVRDLRIASEETVPLDLVLVRNSALLPIITQPTDVEIVVDGQLVGRTKGSLEPDFRSFIDPTAYKLDQLSERFKLATLAVGQHVIELRKDCYEPVQFQFNVEAPQDYTTQVIKLEESVGQIHLTSNPAGARVFLDGEYKGTTPLDLGRVCSGAHHFEVKHVTGKCVENVVLARNEALTLECPIRPSLGFLGVVGGAGVPQRDLDDVRQKLLEAFQKMTAMNFIQPRSDQIATLLGGSGKSPASLTARDPVSGRGELAPEELRVLTDQMSTALEVEALLVAWVPEQRLTKDVWLNLFAKGTTAPDVYSVNYLDPEAIPGFIAKLAEPTPLSRSWIGLRMIDTRLYQGAAVMRIEADGPAAGAGIELGDVVVGSGERTITRASDLLQVVAESAPESALKLAIQGGREVQIRVGSTPIEIPLNRPGYLYNKSIIDLRHRLVAEPEVEPLARLNLALAHLQLGDIETALKEQLPRIKFAGTRGISQGTAAYYWALCYEKLGERGEAVRLYQEAAKHAEATLRSNDGPRVAPLAERKLRELGGAQ